MSVKELGLSVYVLGHPVALKIVELLNGQKKPFSSKEIAKKLNNLPLELVTWYLLELEIEGLVKGDLIETPAGMEIALRVYSIVPEKVEEVMAELGKVMAPK